MSDEKGMPQKGGGSSKSVSSLRDDHKPYLGCCSNCGTETIYDGRDTYTPCSCPTEWVNDGRGGYFVTINRDNDHR